MQINTPLPCCPTKAQPNRFDFIVSDCTHQVLIWPRGKRCLTTAPVISLYQEHNQHRKEIFAKKVECKISPVAQMSGSGLWASKTSTAR